MRLSYLSIMCIALLPACVRYYKWGKKQFTQVDKRCSIKERACTYIRSADVYDEFETVGKFDALWFSEDVQKLYNDAVTSRFGYSSEQKEVLQKQLRSDQAHTIIFYLLMAAPQERQRPLLAASDRKATWAAVLVCDGKEFQAKQIKCIDLEPELGSFFGERYTQYRTAYKIEFDRFSGGKDCTMAKLQLSLRSASYSVNLCW